MRPKVVARQKHRQMECGPGPCYERLRASVRTPAPTRMMSGERAQETLVGERLTQVGNLVAGFAHEVRNPLSTIGLNLQLVKEDYTEAESARDKRTFRRLSVIETEVKRLQAMLEEFLGFVRRPGPKRQIVELNQAIRELVEFATPEMEAAGVSLRLFADPSVGAVPVDADQFRAVLVNLLRNAKEASAAGGEIMVATRRRGDEIVVQVTDTGAGMSPEVRARAFEPYYSTKSDGNGLGLATVRRIVEEHGGSIVVDSDVGKGSQFTITLRPDQHVAQDPERPELAPEGRELPPPDVDRGVAE